MTNMVERVGAAIKLADDEFGYSINLARLVDGVSTYALRFTDLPDDTFELGSYGDALEMMAERRDRSRARAAIEAMRPQPATGEEAMAFGMQGVFVPQAFRDLPAINCWVTAALSDTGGAGGE